MSIHKTLIFQWQSIFFLTLNLNGLYYKTYLLYLLLTCFCLDHAWYICHWTLSNQQLINLGPYFGPFSKEKYAVFSQFSALKFRIVERHCSKIFLMYYHGFLFYKSLESCLQFMQLFFFKMQDFAPNFCLKFLGGMSPNPLASCTRHPHVCPPYKLFSINLIGQSMAFNMEPSMGHTEQQAMKGHQMTCVNFIVTIYTC